MILVVMYYDCFLDFVLKFLEEKGKFVFQKYYDYLDGEVMSKII